MVPNLFISNLYAIYALHLGEIGLSKFNGSFHTCDVKDNMFSCWWIMMLMTVLMKYDADEMRCMQLTRSKDKGRGDEPENGGPAIYLQLTLVQENMEWKRKWKWTWSGKESESEHGVKKKLDFFVDILYSQLVKWPNYQMTVLWELAWLNIRKLIRADQKIAQKRFLRNIKSNIYLDSCAAFDISFVILTSNIFWLQYNFFVILIEMRSLLCNCRKYKVYFIRHRTMAF